MRKLLIPVLMIFLLMGFASADVSFSNTDVTFTVDYNDFADDKDDFIGRSISVSVTNDDPDSDEDVTVSLNVPEDYETTGPNTVTVPAASSTTATFTLNVPHKQDPGETTIGSVVLTKSDESTVSIPLIQDTKQMLYLKEVTVYYTNEDGGNEKDEFDGDEDTFILEENVQLFSEIEIKIELENLFDNDYDKDGEIEDIELRIDSDQDEIFPSGFDDKINVGKIDASKELTHTVKFTIDEDAEAGDYTLELKITGEDGEKIEYEILRELDLELEQQDGDLRFIKADLNPTTLNTCSAHVDLDLKVKNFGGDDEEDVIISVANSELGIDEKVTGLELEELGDDDTWEGIIALSLDSIESASAKSHSLDLRLFINNDDLISQEILSLNVEECEPSASDSNEDSETTSVKTISSTGSANSAQNTLDTTTSKDDGANGETALAQESLQAATTTSTVVKTVEDPYTSQDIFLAVMIVGLVLLVAIIILLIIILLKK